MGISILACRLSSHSPIPSLHLAHPFLSLLRFRLIFPSATIPLLEPLHPCLANLRVPRKKSFQLICLHDRRQLHLMRAMLLRAAVGGAYED